MVEQSIDLIQFSNRLRSARSLVNMNRKEFCERYGFNLHTVQSWESGRYWVRANSLERFCDALAKEGVFCTPEWIVEGKGDGPKLVTTDKDFAAPSDNGDSRRSNLGSDLEEQLVKAEIEAFKTSHEKAGINVVVTRILDSAMLPQFSRGDYVGGRIQAGGKLKSLFGKDCIIEIGANNYLVRRLCSDGKRMVLVPAALDEAPLVLDEIAAAAEIIWHRKAVKNAI